MNDESENTVIVHLADYARIMRSSENPPSPEYERDIPVPKEGDPEQPAKGN